MRTQLWFINHSLWNIVLYLARVCGSSKNQSGFKNKCISKILSTVNEWLGFILTDFSSHRVKPIILNKGHVETSQSCCGEGYSITRINVVMGLKGLPPTTTANNNIVKWTWRNLCWRHESNCSFSTAMSFTDALFYYSRGLNCLISQVVSMTPVRSMHLCNWKHCHFRGMYSWSLFSKTYLEKQVRDILVILMLNISYLLV